MQVALVLAALTLQAPSPSTVRPAVPIRDWLLGAPAGVDAADEGPPRAVPEWRPISITPDTVLMLDRWWGDWPDAEGLYAASAILSPADTTVQLVVTRRSEVRLWLNGQRLSPADSAAGTPIDIRLAAGWNSLLVALPRRGTFGAWLLGEGPLEVASRPPPRAGAHNLPAASFTVSRLTVHAPLSWRGAALETDVSVRVAAWGRVVPGQALLHLVVAGDTLTVDPVSFPAPAAAVTIRRTRDLGSLSRAALAPTQTHHVLVTPGHVSIHPAGPDPAALLGLLDGPIRLAAWHLNDGGLEARVVIPPALAGLTLDLLVTDLGPHAWFRVNGAIVPRRRGRVTLCERCPDGETLVTRIGGEPSTPAMDLPAARVRNVTYTDLTLNWQLVPAASRGRAPDAPAWLAALLDTPKQAYRELAASDLKRIQTAGAPFRNDTLYLIGRAPAWPDSPGGGAPEQAWRDVLAVQRQFPDARVVAEGAWAYRQVAARAPALLDSIRKAVRAGAWTPVGGMWAAARAGTASGEALVRQGLYGQAEFQRLFDRRCSIAWAADGAALPWTLPQIWRGLGMERLIAVGGEDSDAVPAGAFLWEGRDGSRLATYRVRDGALSGRQAKQALGVAASGRSALALYGTDDSAQRGLGDALRITAELRRLPAFATLVDTAPERAFDAVRSRAEPLPVWRGGVPSSARARPPTSRTLEGELLATELFATIDTATYPAAVLERAWHVLLEGGADAADEEVWAAVRDARGNALRHLARNLDTGGAGTAVVVFNPSGWVRSGRVALPLDAALRRSRRLGLSRVVDAARRTAPVAFDPDSLSFFAREVPPLGAKVFWLERGPAAGGGPEAGPARLENAFLTVDIDTVRGRVRAVRHKAMGRDLLARGAGGNRLTPLGASDQGLPVERDRPAIEAARALRRGGDALERWIELEHPWGDGALVQRFTLRHGEPLLYIRGSLEGGPPGIVATFDLTVAGDSAWSELPYGAVALLTGGDAPARPMAHGRWTDQADAEFGVALLTDRPVTWDVRGPTVRFALTSDGATPTVDGVFHYALYAHAGDWRAGHAARRAAELAQPLLATRAASHGGAGGHAWSFLTLDAEHVSVGAVKRADVGRAVVVRLVEGEGRAGRVTLTSSRAMARVRAANLLEDPLAIVPLTSEHVVTLSLEPWEIRTLLIDELR